ncbi:MAG: hypothetical protein C0602_11335 [Denitrovibrio sp.]|nr:MAG: hypothetical protein C0602_11335 [Denitrovibrio sp.]
MSVKELKIIVVEDDPIIRFTMVRMLKNRFSEVDSAENGKEGLKKVTENDYDIVVTDLQMPIMDGHSMIKNLRENQIDTPVIICSAYDFEETEKYKCKWMSKPIIIDNLIDMIQDSTANI